MILKFIKQTSFQQPIQYKFASAAAAAIDYYSLLGLQKGATTEQIKQAFKRITTNVTPDNNPSLFGRLNEAFVILSDGKTRDAYDSLVRSRKVSFASIREKEEKPKAPHSYIADRKAEKEKQLSKRYNLDKFGRYRGGVPNRNSDKRGKSLGQTGELFNQRDTIDADPFPQFTHVDSAKAESFKNFHQRQRQHRTAKPTWISVEVDYLYFSPTRFSAQWKFWRWILLFGVLMPVIAPYFLGVRKRMNVWLANRKKQQKIEKAEKAARQKQQKQKQAREKQAKEQEKQAKEAEARQQAQAKQQGEAQVATAQSK